MRNPNVLVCVPFKDEIEHVKKFVDSLLQSYIYNFNFTLILWDDGSTNETLDLLYNKYKTESIIIKHKNVEYTQSVFDAFEVFKNQLLYDYILLVNSDVILKKECLYNLVKRMTMNPNYAAVGGKVLNTDEKIIHTGTKIENSKIVDPYVGLDINDTSANFVERRLWTNGCCTLYNLHILRKENLNFDLDFKPAYFEESDLMTRLNILGYAVLYEPRSELFHLVGGTMKKEKYEKIFWENWGKYLNKYEQYFDNPKLQF